MVHPNPRSSHLLGSLTGDSKVAVDAGVTAPSLLAADSNSKSQDRPCRLCHILNRKHSQCFQAFTLTLGASRGTCSTRAESSLGRVGLHSKKRKCSASVQTTRHSVQAGCTAIMLLLTFVGEPAQGEVAAAAAAAQSRTGVGEIESAERGTAVRVASTKRTFAYILNSSEAKRSSVVCGDVSVEGDGDWLAAPLLAIISASLFSAFSDHTMQAIAALEPNATLWTAGQGLQRLIC